MGASASNLLTLVKPAYITAVDSAICTKKQSRSIGAQAGKEYAEMNKTERTIAVFAMRYAMKRKTYALSIVLDHITENIKEFDKWEIEQIKEELSEGRTYFNESTINKFMQKLL